ncbi:MAG: hypothetical protein JW780_06735 [Clostridiales bacterium]|nr:hypothetical protein [Clostridiales bacterium]
MKKKAPWLVLGIICAIIAVLVFLTLFGIVFMSFAIRSIFNNVDGNQISNRFTSTEIQSYVIMAVTGLAFIGGSVLGFVKFAKNKSERSINRIETKLSSSDNNGED